MSSREIAIAWGQGIVGHVAQTGVSCNVKNCYEDPRLVGFILDPVLCLLIELSAFNEVNI